MFSYSKMELANLAKELNFVRDTLEKVIRLSEILDFINSNPIMKHRLALKGGTAINLTVFNLPRLSVDIDLDYCVNNSRNVIELFAAKINALLSRSAIRDFYDVYNMIEYKLFNKLDLELLRKSVVFYTLVSQEVIPEFYDLSVIDRINSRKIRSELLPVIKKGTFVKLDDMKEVVKDYLSKLLDITENEKKFLDLFKKKVYKPELLFDDAGILNRIKDHYMIAWKLQDHNKD